MKQLGRYELLEALGQGGMGEVWLARLSGAAGFEKPCIVKTVLPGLTKDPQFVARFQHEAKVLVHLQHSNIASVYDMGEADGALFMALEYVAGVDLSRLQSQVQAQSEVLPVPVALFIAQHAAEALGYAHRKLATDGSPLELVHRDVSPHNVMISYEGEVKVIDFGIARSATRVHATQAATVMGKLGYMAPEQAMARPIDARADQYALGVVLWEMLSGKEYIPNGTGPEMIAAMGNPTYRSLVGMRSEADAQLDAVVKKALEANPADRYESCDALALALAQELMRFGGQPPKTQIGQYVKSRCSAEWKENQQLLSKISSMRRAEAPTSVDGPNPERRMATPSLSTDAAMQAMKPNRTPLFVGLAAVLILGGGVALALKLNDKPQVDDPKNVAGAKEPSPPVAEVKPPPPVEKVTPPPVAPVDVAGANAAGAQNVAAVADAGAQTAAVVPAAGGTVPAGPKVTAKKVFDVFIDRGEPYARAGSTDGLKVGVEVKVVTAPLEKEQRVVLGSATVLEVFPKMARLSLDPAAAGASGTKFIALDATAVALTAPVAAVADAGTKPVAAANPGARGKLLGDLQLIHQPSRCVKLFNRSSIGWSNCSVYIPGQYKFSLARLPAGAAKEIPLVQFVADPKSPALDNAVRVECAQGALTMAAQ